MKKKIIIALILICLTLVILAIPQINLYLAGAKKTLNNQDVEFYFRGNLETNELAELLIKEGFLKDKEGFLKVANYKRLKKSKLSAGKYIIKAKTPIRHLLNGFTLNSKGNGNAEVEVDVTFNNCRDIYQLCGKVAKNLMLDSSLLATYITSDECLSKYDFTLEQLPSLFLPNTYKMYWDTDEKAFVERMAKEFKQFWTTERKNKIKSIGLESPSQVVTLASIVYSEQSRNPSEWPIIAGLYLNRINKGIKLQSDPTFKFCWGNALDSVQRLTFEHRDKDCPYNTYIYSGLPPGPICIPPVKVVDAVLNREKNEFLFLIAKPDYSGLHDFSVDYSKHSFLAKKYSQWLVSEGIR
ncbi:MAG: endolytic transglycosylase MltG [Flavobacteriia bacterium]|nr:endolytic transglycosylase MltG [Flavobacteriia bacterium]